MPRSDIEIAQLCANYAYDATALAGKHICHTCARRLNRTFSILQGEIKQCFICEQTTECSSVAITVPAGSSTHIPFRFTVNSTPRPQRPLSFWCPHCSAALETLDYSVPLSEYGTYSLPEVGENARDGNYDSCDYDNYGDYDYSCPECGDSVSLEDLLTSDPNEGGDNS